MDIGSFLQEGLQRLGYQFVPFLIAVVVHEFGHGLMANFWGDTTARDSGRLTLNPAPHIDPIGTLLFPIINMLTAFPILIGWARPVPIEPRYFRKYRPGLFWVSLAGSLANIVTAFVCGIVLCLMLRFVQPEFIFYKEFAKMLEYGILINLALGVFNQIPLPPLDGSRVVESIISYEANQTYQKIAPYTFFILMAMMLLNLMSFLMIPIQFLYNLVLIVASTLTGVS